MTLFTVLYSMNTKIFYLFLVSNFIPLFIIRGKAMANYPQDLAQDAVCQSYTGHMTGLWFLPARPLRLNTNE